MAKRVLVTGTMYQLRFYSNPHQWELIGTYGNAALAYGMKNQKNALYPQTYPLNKLKVVQV